MVEIPSWVKIKVYNGKFDSWAWKAWRNGLLSKDDDWAKKKANVIWAMKKEWWWIGLMCAILKVQLENLMK